MNLSRRDFLKLLGATATVATVGLPAVTTVATAPLLLTAEEMALIDTPTTPANPLFWLGIDQYWYPAGRIDMRTETIDITDISDMYQRVVPLSREFSAIVFGMVDNRLAFEIQERSIVFRWYGHVYRCRGYVRDVSVESQIWGDMTDLSFAMSSALERL